jgi:hypothetical protein
MILHVRAHDSIPARILFAVDRAVGLGDYLACIYADAKAGRVHRRDEFLAARSIPQP